MNKQTPGIEWTHVWGRDGYTWNVSAGCMHGCRWVMPDGEVAVCYAESAADGLARRAYPEGFGHAYWHPERLDEPSKLRQPAGIFISSMSDLMGAWVSRKQIEAVLDVCRQTPQHVYFLLTKNAPRLMQFEFPDNVWVGASVPPSWMHRRALTRKQQTRMLRRSLEALSGVRALVRWMSFEPLAWDVSEHLADFPAAIDWGVIGAASSGRRIYPPSDEDALRLVEQLDKLQKAVFFKRNLQGSAAWARYGPRMEWPDWARPILGGRGFSNREGHKERGGGNL